MTEDSLPSAGRWTTATWLAISTTVIVAVLIGVSIKKRQDSLASGRESAMRVARAAAVQADLLDLETGQRGYLLAGEARYLEPFRAASERMRADTEALLKSVATSEHTGVDENRRIADLARLKFEELDSTIALNRIGRQADALAIVRTDTGKRLMDSVRSVVAALEARESQVQAERAEEENYWARIIWATLTIGAALTVAVLLFLRWTLLQYERAQRAAMRELDHQLSALEEQSRMLAAQESGRQGSAASPGAAGSASSEQHDTSDR